MNGQHMGMSTNDNLYERNLARIADRNRAWADRLRSAMATRASGGGLLTNIRFLVSKTTQQVRAA